MEGDVARTSRIGTGPKRSQPPDQRRPLDKPIVARPPVGRVRHQVLPCGMSAVYAVAADMAVMQLAMRGLACAPCRSAHGALPEIQSPLRRHAIDGDDAGRRVGREQQCHTWWLGGRNDARRSAIGVAAG